MALTRWLPLGVLAPTAMGPRGAWLLGCRGAPGWIRTPNVAQWPMRQRISVTASSDAERTASAPVAQLRQTAQVGSGDESAVDKAPPGYLTPPQEIAEIVDIPSVPLLSLSPDRKKVLQLIRPPPLPPLLDLAQPELKLAGLRIDPQSFSRSRASYYTDLAFVDGDQVVPAPEDVQTPVTGIPKGMLINGVSFSNKGTRLAFTLRSPGGPDTMATLGPRGARQLWVADVDTCRAHPVSTEPCSLNTIFQDYLWLDEDTLVAFKVPDGLGDPPARPMVPSGPVVQDNSTGKQSQTRTYQDLLKDHHDEEQFEYYTTSQLVVIDARSGEILAKAAPRMYTGAVGSPDSRYLLVSWMDRPFSYETPCGRFPKKVELWDRNLNSVMEVANLPLAEDIPIAFDSCRKGPRAVRWRSDADSQICWIEAQDGGDPAVECSPRDIVYTLEADAAYNGTAPQELARTDFRCSGVTFCDGDLALVYEAWWKTRRSIVKVIAPDRRSEEPRVLFDRNYEDVYNDPGSPMSRRTSNGSSVLAKIDGERKLLMQGSGASEKGNKPFLDVLDVDSGATQRIWESSPPHFEYVSSILNDEDDRTIALDGLQVLLSRESVQEVPQYIAKTFHTGAPSTENPMTKFPHPYPQMKDIQKEIIRYKRADGVVLTATLYLPVGYDKDVDGPLKCLMWAYPREFKSKDAAGQLRRSPYEFSSIGSTAPLLWLARKYAVLDGPTFPIVAEGDEEPNDTYVEQLTASAEAAVKEVVRRGVVDEKNIAVGGHSYGAFMAANLLAHCPHLFACGIAKSGAYNRTLTPFSFQAEQRTLWETPDVYIQMSPFMMADKIKKPLLLIHGQDDNNPGTFPMQSERFYQALKGHGAQCRLVLLPHESHGYQAKESIMHTLYEMDRWLELHCNNE